jgi:diguanylate cyclase (GGDEF)-like protein/hemerythrin-like metal-binding protein/PAS domain S-box-containing protein
MPLSGCEGLEKYRIAFECANVGFALTGIDGAIFEANPMLTKIFGYSEAKLVCMNVLDLALVEDAPEVAELIRGAPQGDLVHSFMEKRFVDQQGKMLYAAVSCGLGRNRAGELLYLIITFRDVTEHKRLETMLEEQATYDPLTRALNRRRLEERGIFELLRSDRHGNKLTVVMADLDHFKTVNDTHGHAVGDEVLSGFSDIVRKCLRLTDLFGRWGGEEFVLLLPETGPVGAQRVAERVRAALVQAVFAGDVRVTVSLGVAARRPGESFAELLRRADAAMYLAKQQGRNRVVIDARDLPREVQTKTLVPHLSELHWRRSYGSGDADIDREHRHLFDVSNLILAAMSPEGDWSAIASLVDELLAEVSEHFSHEEQILEELCYPGLEEHKQCHHNLLIQAEDLAMRVKRREVTPGALLGFVTQDVVAKHILQEDLKYHPWLRKGVAAVGSERRKAARRNVA